MPTPEAWKNYTVSFKDDITDAIEDWAVVPNLVCTSLRRALMPTIDRAEFILRAGEVMNPGQTTFQSEPNVDFDGKYVRIECLDLSIDWIGYFVNDDTTRASAFDDGGLMKLKQETPDLIAVGLEWFLTRTPIDSSVYYQDATNVVRVDSVVGYNMGSGEGRDISFAARGNKDTRLTNSSRVFAADSDNATLWTAADMVDNLLFFHGPMDKNGVHKPFEYKFDFGTSGPFLDSFGPTIQREGRTVFQVLNQIIDPRRGLTWWTEYSDGDPEIVVKVSSVAPSIVALPGGGTIPAATTQNNYDFDSDVTVRTAKVAQDSSRKYDRVKVRGARRTTTCTVSITDATLESSWLASEETAYKAAASATNPDKADRFRKAQRFERVYRAFRIPENWNGKTSDGLGGSQEFASPDMPPGSTSIVGGKPALPRGLRVLRTTQLLAGYDYTIAGTPVTNLPANTKPEFLKPFGLVQHNNKYVFLSKARRHIDEDESTSERLTHSYTVSPLAGVPGVDIKSTGSQHSIALNHFDSGSPAPTNTDPEIDFEDVLCTVSIEWDSYCEGVWPTADPDAEPIQTLLIDAGSRVRLDYLAVNTVFDINDSGQPRKVTTGGPIQDDRRLCEDIARAAFEWYSIPRRELRLAYHNLQEPVALGSLITQIGTTGEAYVQTINAVCSQWTHNLEAGKSSMTAGYAEVDWQALVA